MLIASCALRGLPCATQNDHREKLLCEIVRSLREKDLAVDAIVLSGGYFVQDDPSICYLDRTLEERRELLKASLGARVCPAAQELNELKEGALLIFGVDTRGPKSALGDHLCVAWSADGPERIGRKVFPTKDEGHDGYVVNVADFGAKDRVVEVCGKRVLLCACYDGYGIARSEDKRKYIRKLRDGEGFIHQRIHRRRAPEFTIVLDDGLRKWRKLLKGVDAAAVAIHMFPQTGNGGFSTNRWRRHGIATASAKLNGSWVVAGANFEDRIPYENIDILASDNVPKAHLELAGSRKTRDSEPVCDFKLDGGDARVRVFKFGRYPQN